MILGMNVLEFVLLAWVGCTAIAWACDFGPDIYDEQKAAYLVRHPKEEVSETTVTLAVGSYDPDETMKIPRIVKTELDLVFVLGKAPEHFPRRRHAKG